MQQIRDEDEWLGQQHRSSLEVMILLTDIKEKAAKTKTTGWIINIAVTVIAIFFYSFA